MPRPTDIAYDLGYDLGDTPPEPPRPMRYRSVSDGRSFVDPRSRAFIDSVPIHIRTAYHAHGDGDGCNDLSAVGCSTGWPDWCITAGLIYQDGAAPWPEHLRHTYGNCDRCRETFDTRSLSQHGDMAVTYCRGCTDRYVRSCSECDTTMSRGSVYTLDGDEFCRSCYYDHPECEECGCVYRDGENDMCRSCYNESTGTDSQGIHHYTFRPPFRFDPPGNSLGMGEHEPKEKTLYLGVEVEMESRGRWSVGEAAQYVNVNAGERLYCKGDGSLDDGMEIVSHPSVLEAHRKRVGWPDVLQKMRRNGMRSHDTTTCGIHVHVPRSWFTNVELVKLGIFVYANRPKLEELARRGEGDYNKFPEKAKRDMGRAGREGRYEAVNFNNNSTIEFRMFRGSLRTQTFMATLELVDAICRYVKTINTVQASAGNWGHFWGWCGQQGKVNQKDKEGKEITTTKEGRDNKRYSNLRAYGLLRGSGQEAPDTNVEGETLEHISF